MSHTIYWNHAQDFTPEEWKLIYRQAARLSAESAAAGVPLTVDLTQPDRIRWNGVGEQRGETFDFTRQIRPRLDWEEPGDELHNWCKTRQMPYGRPAESLLRFAARLAPETLAVGRDMTELEAYRQQREEAEALAVQVFLDRPAAHADDVAAEISETVLCETTLARDVTRQVRREVVDARFAPHLFRDGPLHLELTAESGLVDADYGKTEVHVVASLAEAAGTMRVYVATHGIEDDGSAGWEEFQPVAFGRFFRHPPEPESLEVGTLGQDGTTVRVICPDLINHYAAEVNESNPYRPAADPLFARQHCATLAEEVFVADEGADLNNTVNELAQRVHTDADTARAGVEDAHRAAVNTLPLLEELWRAKSRVFALQDGCRRNGGSSPQATTRPATGGGPLRLDHHFGTLLARAAGEWEVAFASAERALSDPDEFYRLAAVAAGREQEDGPDEYPCVLYRQEQAKRASVHLLLGSFARWRTAAATFTRTLAHLLPDGSPGVSLAAYIQGNGALPESGDPLPTLAEAVGALARTAAVVDTFKVGSAREVARDYLNLLEVAHELGLEPVQDTEVFRHLNRVARGSERTAAEETRDFLLERQGEAMLGETSAEENVESVEGGLEHGGQWNLYRTEAPPRRGRGR